jgi:hypothetical protein
MDSNQNGSIDGNEFKVGVVTFLIPALVDTFDRRVTETVFINGEIDEIYWSGLIGDGWDETVFGDEDPYWAGYDHGFDDGYAIAYYDFTGEWPEEFLEDGEDYYEYYDYYDYYHSEPSYEDEDYYGNADGSADASYGNSYGNSAGPASS